MMTLREFHNGLRILTNIDLYELVEAGIIEADDEAEWKAFRDNPHRWLILADDEQSEKLWALMVKRGAIKGAPANFDYKQENAT